MAIMKKNKIAQSNLTMLEYKLLTAQNGTRLISRAYRFKEGSRNLRNLTILTEVGQKISKEYKLWMKVVPFMSREQGAKDYVDYTIRIEKLSDRVDNFTLALKNDHQYDAARNEVKI